MGIAADTEVQLIQQAARGNPDAFASLFDSHYQSIFNFALWLCNDADLAEDLTQETFIRAHGSLRQLGPPWKLRSWLCRTARNLYFNYRRDHPSTSPLDTDTHLPSADLDPERQLLRAELSGPARSALQRLSPQHREALTLREVEGFHYGDIAEALGISVDNVKVVLHRARASFKENYSLRLLLEDPQPDCDVLNELLDALHDKEALGVQEDMVRAHVKDCPTCQQRKRLMAVIALLFKAQPTFPPPDGLRERVLARTRHRRGGRRALPLTVGGAALTAILALWWFMFGPASGGDGGFGRGGGGDEAAPTEPPIYSDSATASAPTPETCGAGWLPESGCACCGTTLTCADGTVATFNPECGVGGGGGSGGGGGQCHCVCAKTDVQTKKCIAGYDSCNPQTFCLP